MSDGEDDRQRHPNGRGKAEESAYPKRVGAHCRPKPAEQHEEQ